MCLNQTCSAFAYLSIHFLETGPIRAYTIACSTAWFHINHDQRPKRFMSSNSPSEMTTKTNTGGFLGLLRIAAVLILVVGFTGSLVFMFRAGQHTPRLLLILFTIWVLAPFVALFWANTVSKRWSAVTRATLHCVMLIVSLGSLAIYGEWIDVRPAGSANAFLFVIVPPVSLIFIAIVVPITAFISGRLSRPDDRI